MLLGFFDPRFGRPFYRGAITLPRLNKHTTTDLLFDTGADKSKIFKDGTVLFPVTHSDFILTGRTTGAGGVSHGFIEPAILMFRAHDKSIYTYRIAIDVSFDSPGIAIVLGRDIIDRWAIRYNKTNRQLEADVITYDGYYPPPP